MTERERQARLDRNAKIGAIALFPVLILAWVAMMHGIVWVRNYGQSPHSDNPCTPAYVQAHPSSCPEDPIGGPGLP